MREVAFWSSSYNIIIERKKHPPMSFPQCSASFRAYYFGLLKLSRSSRSNVKGKSHFFSETFITVEMFFLFSRWTKATIDQMRYDFTHAKMIGNYGKESCVNIHRHLVNHVQVQGKKVLVIGSQVTKN